jgi:hypothetical protein
MKVSLKAQFLSAETKPYSFTDETTGEKKSGKTVSIKVLSQEDETETLKGSVDTFPADFVWPKRWAEVECDLNIRTFRDGKTNVKVESLRGIS